MDNIKGYIQRHIEQIYYLTEHSCEEIDAISKSIIDCFNSGCKLLVCGNGGSAADAQHIATEMVCRFTRNRMALPAIALTCDTSLLTAVPNDFDFDYVFARQVEGLANSGDILLAISTSGSSPNVIRAAQTAKDVGVQVIALTGKPDSELEKMADMCLCAHCDEASISQEMHQVAYHIICDLVEAEFSG